MRRQTYFRQFELPSLEPFEFEPLGTAEVVARTQQSVRLRTGRSTVEVTALADDLFRVGLFGDGRPVDYRSEAVPQREWPAVEVKRTEQPITVELDTGQAAATISLAPLRVTFHDATGRRIAADDPDRGMGFVPLAPQTAQLTDPLGAPALVYKQHLPGTHYFGCGERTGGLDKTGSHQIFWNTDPPLGHTASLNNLYTSVPFVMALQDGQAWGMFVDSSSRVEFDLGNEEPTRCGFAVDGGPLVYYIFAGPSPRAVLERYTELTGRISLPPRWALGYHQSRWGYKTADEVLQLARTFRDRDLPLDALYLDIDYMDGYRVFTWSDERFPDPTKLVRQLAELGVQLITIVDPGVKIDEQYAVYTSGRDADLFCKTFEGAEYHNVVWPGMCAFPDFTNPRARTWWSDNLSVLLDAGVAGIWCDMNEPTVFVPTPSTFPADVVHHGEGEPKLHAEVHNLYGQFMARATHEGLRRLRPERRPFVISRAGFAGLQRYALHWTGDNTSWWEHLFMSMPQLQNLGLSGYAFVGVDIGGFMGDATGELLTRWVEFGIFEPFCRNHSAWTHRPQEPWAFGEPYETHIRELLQLRQRLMPYLYTLFEEAHRTGAPILRPLLFEFPADVTTYAADDEFLLGPTLLVAPIARPGTEYRHVYLPLGTWVQHWTGERVVGPVHSLAHAPLGQPAVYVRANTPLPLWPVTRNATEAADRAPEPLTWLVYVASAEEGRGEVYDDAGDGYGHESGDFARVQAVCRVLDVIELELRPLAGSRSATLGRVELDLRGVTRPTAITVDGVTTTDWDHADNRLRVSLRASNATQRIRVNATVA
ncbi:MAG TPA: TIM-barrel domain-containing protein [Chloroflexota bacterium]|nr:TIM-barrel domain-containing protein [Chloroflexota bacterium]